ncbi:hypothetical protein HDU92_006912 [Lobulomyces angularis]|nr:hypothetical protein HDU92_006912 [Lobulomyces angularis]
MDATTFYNKVNRNEIFEKEFKDDIESLNNEDLIDLNYILTKEVSVLKNNVAGDLPVTQELADTLKNVYDFSLFKSDKSSPQKVSIKHIRKAVDYSFQYEYTDKEENLRNEQFQSCVIDVQTIRNFITQSWNKQWSHKVEEGCLLNSAEANNYKMCMDNKILKKTKNSRRKRLIEKKIGLGILKFKKNKKKYKFNLKLIEQLNSQQRKNDHYEIDTSEHVLTKKKRKNPKQRKKEKEEEQLKLKN